MHSSKFFRLMQERDISILEYLDKSEQALFKDTLVACILSTDMASHNEITARFT